MKPGRIFHFTFGAFSWLAVLTKASPVPTSLDHSYVLVPRTEGEPSVHQRSSSASIEVVPPNKVVPEKPQKKKRVKWLDEQMDPLGEASANTHETAGLGHDHPLMKIVISKAKEEWISSQAPIPSAVYKLQRNLGEKATGSRASLLKFASGEKDAQDQELLKWQTALMDSQQAMFMQIPTTAHDKQSVALQLLLECLKIFLFPVYRKVNYIAKVRTAAIGNIIYYQKVLEKGHGVIDWEKCSNDPNNLFTDEKAHQLLEKVEELLKSKPDSGKEIEIGSS